MNDAKTCQDRFEDIVAFTMGELDADSTRELKEHLAVCADCRRTRDSLAAEEASLQAVFDSLASGLEPVEETVLAVHPSRVRERVSNNQYFERVRNMIISHKRVSIVAAATLTTLAAGLLLYVSLFSFSTPAYALEQTLQANEQVTSYHAKISPTWGGMSEVWVQLNPDGSPLRARIDYPKTEDGAKVVICSKDKASVWFKDKKVYTTVPEKKALDRVVAMQKMCDPKVAFQMLQKRKKAGKVEIETTEPEKKGDFLRLTVIFKDAPYQKEVYEVNPATKLAERVTYYSRKGGKWKEVKLIEYRDYNKPIDPKVFDLVLPENTMIVNEITNPPGLLKGDLTNKQIAKKVAREFFEALIAKDYDKAGLIFGGMPAERIKEYLGRIDAMRIVAIDEPLAGLHPDPSALAVKVKVECGTRKWIQEYTPQMRLTDNETATKTAREFFEAIIRQDEAAVRKALAEGLIFEGFSDKNADKIKDFFEHYNVLRIVEVGKPVPYSETKLLEIPVKVELEMKKERIREFTPYIRHVYNQPDRWNICDVK